MLLTRRDGSLHNLLIRRNIGSEIGMPILTKLSWQLKAADYSQSSVPLARFTTEQLQRAQLESRWSGIISYLLSVQVLPHIPETNKDDEGPTRQFSSSQRRSRPLFLCVVCPVGSRCLVFVCVP